MVKQLILSSHLSFSPSLIIASIGKQSKYILILLEVDRTADLTSWHKIQNIGYDAS